MNVRVRVTYMYISCKVNFFFTIMMLSFDFIQVLMLAAIPLAAYVKHLNFFSVHHTLVTNNYISLLLLLLLCSFSFPSFLFSFEYLEMIKDTTCLLAQSLFAVLLSQSAQLSRRHCTADGGLTQSGDVVTGFLLFFNLFVDPFKGDF